MCVCVCVCVFGIHVIKIVVERWFWEVNMVFGSLVELHAWLHSYLCFSLLEKLILKASSTPPRHLAICQASKLFLIAISTPPRHLVDWSRNSCPLNSFLTPGGSIEPHLLCLMFSYLDTYLTPISVDGQILDTLLDTSRHLHLSSFIEVLYILPRVIRTSFLSISLSIALSLHLPNTLISLPIFSLRFRQAFIRVSSLGKLLISHSSCISCFET